MRSVLYCLCLAGLTLISCGGKNAQNTDRKNNINNISAPADFPVPKKYTYNVVREYPHSTESYTQGFLWYGGELFESTGQHGSSRLMKVDLETGKTIAQSELKRKFFGEGIAALNNKIYLLTWEEGKAFVYDAAALKLLNTFSFIGEGWGITTDGKKLYMSDGTDLIYVRDPDTFEVERTINVTQRGRPVGLINELEWIDGKIWANIYMYSDVVIIDPATGYIVGVVDFSGIKNSKDRLPGDDVFNGIAYKEDEGRIFVTGKMWNKVYEVEVFEK